MVQTVHNANRLEEESQDGGVIGGHAGYFRSRDLHDNARVPLRTQHHSEQQGFLGDSPRYVAKTLAEIGA